MVTMVTSPGNNVTCLNCEIVEFWDIEQTRKSFFEYIECDNIHINWVIVCLKLAYDFSNHVTLYSRF